MNRPITLVFDPNDPDCFTSLDYLGDHDPFPQVTSTSTDSEIHALADAAVVAPPRSPWEVTGKTIGRTLGTDGRLPLENVYARDLRAYTKASSTRSTPDGTICATRTASSAYDGQ